MVLTKRTGRLALFRRVTGPESRRVVMICNVGGLDRRIRYSVGVALLLVLFAPIRIGFKEVALVAAIYALATAALRYCPVNALIGFSSCRKVTKAPDE
jgi:Inner membrane protein YgaP-like, transmembrane domain